VFTTHTPVPAGNDRFDPKLTLRHVGWMLEDLGMTKDQLLALGREDPGNKSEEFCMTVLALRLSAHCNGVAALHGDTSLEAIEVAAPGTSETTWLRSDGLFILIGADTETGWLPQEIARDQGGFVLTGSDVAAVGRWELERDPYLLETSVPGIFACGDVRYGPVKRVAAAVGEGSMAIAFVHQFLRGLEAPVEA